MIRLTVRPAQPRSPALPGWPAARMSALSSQARYRLGQPHGRELCYTGTLSAIHPTWWGAATMATTRRLAAILAADVAGYSRLMGADEEGTHERLKAHLDGVVNPKIAEHRGRIVKNTGDGFLAEFPSVVDAVRCAVEIQRGMAEKSAETPPERRIEFRIGVNLVT